VGQPSRIIVLGIDGVPYSLLSDLIKRGELPRFAQFAAETGLRQMDSVQPTVSSVAWTSYVTGRQAGKHGIYGFIERKPDEYAMTIPLSTSVAVPNIWEVLSAAGKRVFGMNVPVTYPPRAVNGILIGGFLCPDIAKVANPPQVGCYLRSVGYEIDTDAMLARKSKDLMLPNIYKTVDARMEAMFHFLAQEKWDYFHTHIMATDRLNHFLLGRYEAGESKDVDEFVRFYRKLDEYLGRLLDVLPNDAAIVVMSDHGFCPIKSEVQLSRYLVEKGWTVPAGERPRHPLDIDPSRSKVYSLIPGRIRVNVRGREPAGVVPPEEFRQVRDEVARDLRALHGPDGGPVVRETLRREELYWPAGQSGPDADMPLDRLLTTDTAFGRGPDLVVVPQDGYDLKMGMAAPETFVNTALEGMHTFHDALIMSRGVDLPEERFAIPNVTRHVLQTLGVDPPDDMD